MRQLLFPHQFLVGSSGASHAGGATERAQKSTLGLAEYPHVSEFFVSLVGNATDGFYSRELRQLSDGVSGNCGNEDQSNRGHRFERSDYVNRLNHTGPENEIDDWLCSPDQNEKRPTHMPVAEQRGEHQNNFIRIRHSMRLSIESFPHRNFGVNRYPVPGP